MKIEGNRPNPLDRTQDAPQAQQLEQTRPGRSSSSGAGSAPGNDRVDLSSDARLMDNAVKAVERTPDVRQDVVERARQKLASGELGKDVNALADRMIDSLLNR
jgi:flagellar biosynthesis anti-sigma factor FlgM